jgi:C4-dicarboxylate transporter DctM subunit
MDNSIIGIIGIVVLIAIFLLRMPVGFAMAFVGLIGIMYLVSPAAGLSVVARDFYEMFGSYSLTVIPMFVLMGAIAFASGISKRLYEAGYILAGKLPGGLAMATIIACAGFAAICGSTNATAAAMGKVALPEMKRYGYDDSLATGCVASAGTLGILIPPSTIFIVYGIQTEQSIGKLFISGVIPGIILTILFILVVAFQCWRNPKLAPAGGSTTWKEKIDGLTGIIETVFLFLLVILGIFLGWFSPTQAAAAGCAATLIIGLIRRQIIWKDFWEGVLDSLKITCMIMVILGGAIVFGHFMAYAKIPMFLASWASSLVIPPWGVMAVIIILYLIGGCFMDSLAMITLTVPIFYPTIIALGFDPIWFGVIIVLVVQMGVITPPVGINVYVVSGIAKDVPMHVIFKGVWPYLFAMVIITAMLIIWPQLATFLPSFMSY